jgi:hypothetical protein
MTKMTSLNGVGRLFVFSLLAGLGIALPASSQNGTSDLKPPADVILKYSSDACLFRVNLSPKDEIYNEKILVSPQRQQTRIIPAVKTTKLTEVVLKPAREVSKNIPEVSRKVQESIIVSPPVIREVVIPARYETQTRRIEISPKRQEWVVKSTGLSPKVYLDSSGNPISGCETPAQLKSNKACIAFIPTDNIYMLKQIDAVYKTVSEKVLVAPEKRETVTIPAKTKTVTRIIIDQPKRTEVIKIPAVTRMESREVIISPERSETVTIPAVYRDRVSVRKVASGNPVWRPIVCDRDLTPYLIRRVQLALTIYGYNSKDYDGRFTEDTRSALKRYQIDKNIPNGQLTLETLDLLGIPLR